MLLLAEFQPHTASSVTLLSAQRVNRMLFFGINNYVEHKCIVHTQKSTDNTWKLTPDADEALKKVKKNRLETPTRIEICAIKQSEIRSGLNELGPIHSTSWSKIIHFRHFSSQDCERGHRRGQR
ncbi:uncharacterized protein LOC128888103 isoform X2 [Hylaeus anthracinus]|uniref:uncharacterized protein LOC128888103 isoform X2 n=1 Tax=Hylaeus anthracinus TaxID=313031 RepID=UPI0023BA0AB6|nr:uncharacterized protein LOC128888103 isoform X2 [Hylaeus anthracinus]